MCLPTFEIRPFHGPEYDWDYVKKNPGLYRGAGTDKSAICNMDKLGLFFGYGSRFDNPARPTRFLPFDSCPEENWAKLKYHKIDDYDVKIGDECLMVSVKINPPTTVDFDKLPYGTVISFTTPSKGKVYGVIAYNGNTPNNRQIVSLLNPKDTWMRSTSDYYEVLGTLVQKDSPTPS